MNAIVYSLGFVSAVVVILLIAMVVMILKLNKKVSKHEDAINKISTRLDSEIENVCRNHSETEMSINNSIVETARQTIEDAKKYTDSRIDKTLNK